MSTGHRQQSEDQNDARWHGSHDAPNRTWSLPVKVDASCSPTLGQTITTDSAAQQVEAGRISCRQLSKGLADTRAQACLLCCVAVLRQGSVGAWL
eukprot:97459-Chlamydomonas_euryale.AAC.1